MKLSSMLALALLLACASSTGCVVEHTDTPPPSTPPPPPPTPTPIPTPNVAVYRIQPGASTVVDSSNPGYAITANVGGSYRVVWTGNTNAGFDEFSGYVYTPSSFTSVTPGCVDGSCALENGDTVDAPVAVAGGGQQIDFDTFAADGLDGLDFTVDAAGEPVEFYLTIGGTTTPTLVFFTSADTGVVSNPDTIPFALTTQ